MPPDMLPLKPDPRPQSGCLIHWRVSLCHELQMRERHAEPTYTIGVAGIEPERNTLVRLLHHPGIARSSVYADGDCLIANFEVDAVVDVMDILQPSWAVSPSVQG